MVVLMEGKILEYLSFPYSHVARENIYKSNNRLKNNSYIHTDTKNRVYPKK